MKKKGIRPRFLSPLKCKNQFIWEKTVNYIAFETHFYNDLSLTHETRFGILGNETIPCIVLETFRSEGTVI